MVENCINYQQGTPNKVFLVQTVKQASMEVSLAAPTPALSTPKGPLPPSSFWDWLLASGLQGLTFLGNRGLSSLWG